VYCPGHPEYNAGLLVRKKGRAQVAKENIYRDFPLG
jgi:hypothetical protein